MPVLIDQNPRPVIYELSRSGLYKVTAYVVVFGTAASFWGLTMALLVAWAG